MTHYHNLVAITGPTDLIVDIKKNLGVDDCKPLKLEFYIPMSDPVRDSDELKFKRFWRTAHWGFQTSCCKIDSFDVSTDHPDSVALLSFQVITEDGSLEKLVKAVSEKHPRAHIRYSRAVARPALTEFCGVETDWYEGKQTKVTLVKADLDLPHPLFTVWKMFAVLPENYKYKEAESNEVVRFGEEAARQALESFREAARDVRHRILDGVRLFRGKNTAGGSVSAEE